MNIETSRVRQELRRAAAIARLCVLTPAYLMLGCGMTDQKIGVFDHIDASKTQLRFYGEYRVQYDPKKHGNLVSWFDVGSIIDALSSEGRVARHTHDPNKHQYLHHDGEVEYYYEGETPKYPHD
jgi:hypothetical protein